MDSLRCCLQERNNAEESYIVKTINFSLVIIMFKFIIMVPNEAGRHNLHESGENTRKGSSVLHLVRHYFKHRQIAVLMPVFRYGG